MALKHSEIATKSEVKRLSDLFFVGVIVLFIGFSAMFGTLVTLAVSHFDNSQATYQSLRDKISEQGGQVQSMSSKVDELTSAIQDLEKAQQPAAPVGRPGT